MTKLSPNSQLKLDSLKYHGNLSPDTIQGMKEIRAEFYNLAEKVLALGDSRETSTAFTHLQEALFFTNAHFCYTDDQAVKEEILGREECQKNPCCGEDPCILTEPEYPTAA